MSAADLTSTRQIEELLMDQPIAASRLVHDLLPSVAVVVGRHPAITLIRRMALEAIYREPDTSRP